MIRLLVTTPSPRPAAPPQRDVSAPALAPSLAPATGAGRLTFLDGMRGFAALYVVLHHCCQIYQDPDTSPRYGYYPFIPWLLRGRVVAAFMVLSGFCLMIPVAKAGGATLRDGFWSYLKRRIHRIMPCYYIAMALTLLAVVVVPGMSLSTGEFWSRAVPPFSVGNLLSHALLLHWLNPAWVYRINPPYWTLGTEWVLYFLFPLLLLPIFRRFGLMALVAAGVIAGFLPHALLRKTAWHFDWTCPWFLGLFAIGMAGAVLQLSPKLPKGAATFRRLAIGPVGIAVQVIGYAALWRYRVAMDYLFGLSTLWVILYCGARGEGGRATPAPRLLLTNLLQSRPLQAVGKFSYSLYLVHGPVLMLLYRRFDRLGLSANTRAAIMFLAAPPIAVLAAWAFHVLFERPLLPAGSGGSTARRERGSSGAKSFARSETRGREGVLPSDRGEPRRNDVAVAE